jgi:hypothetical protein
VTLSRIQTVPSERIQIAVDGAGPRFLGLSTAERNRRVAHRAEARHPELTGMLRLPDDIALTPALFDHLPRQGTWHILWHPERPPLAWQAAGTIGLPQPFPAPEHTVLDVSTANARQASAWQLLRHSGKPTDSWLARHVHRKISRAVSYVLLRLGLRAPHAMIVTAAIGTVSAWLLAQTSQATMIAGTLLLWLASITGGIDGEMARVSLSESSHGQQLDTMLNHAIHILCYAGVMIGWWRQGIGPGGAVFAFGVALALPATLLLAMHLVRKASGVGLFFVETRPIEIALLDAARATGSLMLRLTAAVFVVFRRESFPLVFAVVSLATGSRAVSAAIVAAFLSFVLLTFVFYLRPIEAMMRQRFAAQT